MSRTSGWIICPTLKAQSSDTVWLHTKVIDPALALRADDTANIKGLIQYFTSETSLSLVAPKKQNTHLFKKTTVKRSEQAAKKSSLCNTELHLKAFFPLRAQMKLYTFVNSASGDNKLQLKWL